MINLKNRVGNKEFIKASWREGIRIDDKIFRVLYSPTQVASAIEKISYSIEEYLAGGAVIVCVLKGGFYFFSKLVNLIDDYSANIEFITVSSYKGNLEPSLNPEIIYSSLGIVENKNILLVDDIYDTGNTINFLKEYLKNKGCNEIKTATLCVRYDKVDKVDYYCFKTEGFIIGCGMDYKGQGRALQGIYVLQSCNTDEAK